MFATMMEGIKEESVGFLFKLEVQVVEVVDDEEEEEAYEPMRHAVPPAATAEAQPQIRAKGLDRPSQPQNLTYSAPSEDGEAEVKGTTVTNADDEFAGTGRNDKCPCGSGKKYKQCHGRPGGPTGLTARVNCSGAGGRACRDPRREGRGVTTVAVLPRVSGSRLAGRGRAGSGR
jgi:preprotein translocase subunit SecA